ncbi:MAG TPA: hypothetical protein VK338_05705, partial [Candidatus Nitrosocosmicus sp.]|nr:hypothetical protein [Candidatus Nitrosocosmicus sp.]
MNITLTLPKDAELHIKNGDQIDFGDKFFSVYSSELVTINVAEKLHIKPETIFHYLNKIIGEEIKKDEIIALKKNGLMTHKIVSDYNGRLKEIDHHTGAIILNVNT